MNRLLLTLLFVILYIWQVLAKDSSPILNYTDCFLEDCQPLKDDPRIQYAYLTVPEDYDNPDRRFLRLALIIIKSANGNPKADPVIHLTGGPGGKALVNEKIMLFRNHPFGQDRDIIMIDFRGIGLSEPQFCNELQEELGRIIFLNLTPANATERVVELFERCFDSLKARGINLNKYNTSMVIKDLEMLRNALGIEKWNLWGISYGTRVAQTYLRDFPQAVRSVIMDSPVPMGYPFWGDQVLSYRNSLNAFFTACKNSSEGNMAFPDLENRFYKALETLKENPLAFNMETAPDGKCYINFQDMHLIFQQMLYNTTFYQAIPWLIRGIEKRDIETFKNLLSITEQNLLGQSDAMLNIVVKYDNGLILNDYKTDQADPLHNALNYFDNILHIANSIDFIILDTLETLAVVSDVPSLILVGSIDPITRPEHAQFLKKSLQKSYLFEFPGNGHGLTRTSECAKKIGTSFLNNPDLDPDASCLQGMKVNPVAWTTTMYYNPRIYTLARKMLFEKQLHLVGGVVILLLSFFAAIIVSVVSLLSRNKKPSVPQLRTTNIITRLSALLAILLLMGLVWFILKTGNDHGPLILMGLEKEAAFVLYISFTVLAGTLLSWIMFIRTLKYSSTGGKILSVLLCFSLLWCSVLVIHYQLFPW